MRRDAFGVLAFVLALSSAAASSAVGGTLHVPAEYATIQACIDAAVGGQDECLVAPGTYNETINFFGKALTVRSSGGADVTTIDAAGIGGSVVTCINHEGPDTVLDGFTITGGTGSAFAGEQSGGGMLTFDSSPTVLNCRFYANTAEVGGGIYNHIFGSPTIIGCTFVGNSAHIGGGMFSLQGSPTVIDCFFEDNHADTGGGGGMASQLYTEPIVTHCTFRRNSAALGGGMYNDWDTNPVLTDCTFDGNAAFAGGAIYNFLDSRPRLARVAFLGNTAESDGGAIYFDESAGTALDECLFAGNRAGRNGGGLFNARGISIVAQVVNRCIFTGNTAASGGGVYNADYNTVTLTESTFEANTAQAGGGMFNGRDVDATLADCTFVGNRATDGGGVYQLGGGSILTRCTFDRNAAADRGGGVLLSLDQHSYQYRTMIGDCVFSENVAASGGALHAEAGALRLTNAALRRNAAQQGGGLALFNDDNVVAGCRFEENTAAEHGGGLFTFSEDSTFMGCDFVANAAAGGGGLYHGGYMTTTVSGCRFERNSADNGGAMFNDFISKPTIAESTFYANRAYVGGAVFSLDQSEPSFQNCTFAGNTATDGAAFYSLAADVTLTHCTVSGNAASQVGGVFYGLDAPLWASHVVLWGNGPNPLFSEKALVGTIRFSDIQGGVPDGLTDGGGNIDMNPQLAHAPSAGPDGLWATADDDYGDMRLQPGSPCIDAGDPDFVPQPDDTDLDGHARVLCARVDIGDYDCDQTVDLTDFAAWEACMDGPLADKPPVAPEGCEAFDFNADGDVDLADFRAWQAAYSNP